MHAGFAEDTELYVGRYGRRRSYIEYSLGVTAFLLLIANVVLISVLFHRDVTNDSEEAYQMAQVLSSMQSLTLLAREKELPYVHTHNNSGDIGPMAISFVGNPKWKTVHWSSSLAAPVSTWHDIELYPAGSSTTSNPPVQMFVEIPRGTHAKNECQRSSLELNPIIQDSKKGVLRFIPDAYPFVYGAFPQTWESPAPDPRVGLPGDIDPVDVIEIGSGVFLPGDIVTVKVLGALAMTGDGDEADWKIIVLDINDPMAPVWNDISDVPWDQKKIVLEFLTYYKVPSGGNPQQFAFNSEYLSSEIAYDVIADTHDVYKGLMNGTVSPDVGGEVMQLACVLCPLPDTKPEFKLTVERARVLLNNMWEDYKNSV